MGEAARVLPMQPAKVLEDADREGVPEPLGQVAVFSVLTQYCLGGLKDGMAQGGPGLHGGPHQLSLVLCQIEADRDVGEPLDVNGDDGARAPQ